MKTSHMKTRTDTFDAHFALESLGGDRLHRNYSPATSPGMMASLRLMRPEPGDYAAVHALATEQLGGGLASADEIQRVDRMTGAAIWVVRRHGGIAGFLAPLALTKAGRDALVEGSFDAANIDESWVARMGAPLAGFYCWCYAGRDQVTRGALVLALRTLIDQHFTDLPFFGKDTTQAGARIMAHLGFHLFDSTPHLFWRCRSLMGAPV